VLAEKYYTVSVEMPYIELKVRVPKRKYCSRIALNRTMITLNVLLTLLNLLPFWITTNRKNLEKEVSKPLMVFSELCFFPYIIIVLISGIILLNSVRKIRSFLKEKDESINTRNMLLHVTSFGLYTLSFLIDGLSSIGA
jgi:hypothetical protein